MRLGLEDDVMIIICYFRLDVNPFSLFIGRALVWFAPVDLLWHRTFYVPHLSLFLFSLVLLSSPVLMD